MPSVRVPVDELRQGRPAARSTAGSTPTGRKFDLLYGFNDQAMWEILHK